MAAYSTAETGHDHSCRLAMAAQTTSHVDIGTSIAVAFARSPMTLAHAGHDLNAASGGRFVLGLGSQIRAHITKRFSMPWSRPAARMREFILAMRAIWANWHEGAAPAIHRQVLRPHAHDALLYRPIPNSVRRACFSRRWVR